MIMLVDLSGCGRPFNEVARLLREDGEKHGLVIRIQREDIFEAMHRI
jgi:predicted amino acid-binding ACT domain protein